MPVSIFSQYHSLENIMKPMPVTVVATPPAPSAVLHAFRLRLLKLLLCCGGAAISLIWFFEASTARLAPIDRSPIPQ